MFYEQRTPDFCQCSSSREHLIFASVLRAENIGLDGQNSVFIQQDQNKLAINHLNQLQLSIKSSFPIGAEHRVCCGGRGRFRRRRMRRGRRRAADEDRRRDVAAQVGREVRRRRRPPGTTWPLLRLFRQQLLALLRQQDHFLPKRHTPLVFPSSPILMTFREAKKFCFFLCH